MIVEQRTYTLHPHIPTAQFLDAYSELGLPVQKKILEGFMGYYTFEFGTQNRVTHFWAFTDLEDRRERRAKLAADPGWQHCIATVRPWLQHMQSEILVPTAFSPEPTVHK